MNGSAHKRIISKKVFIGLLGLAMLVSLYAVAGFVLAPRLIEHYLPKLVQQRLERTVALGEVRVNPFLLTLEVEGFAIEGTHGKPAFAVERLFVDLSSAGLLQRAWVLDQISLTGPQAHLVFEQDGSVSLADLARQWSRSASDGNGAVQRLVLQNFSLENGQVFVSDLSDAQPSRTVIGPIQLQATDIATFSDDKGNFELAAKLPEGGAFDLRGTVSLDPLISRGTVRLDELKAAALWPFFRDELNLEQLRGTARLSADYSFQAEGKPVLRADQIKFELSDLLLARAQQEPMLVLKRIEADGGHFDSSERTFFLPTLEARGGDVRVVVGSDGDLNWQQLATAGAGADPARTNTKQWKAQIESLRIAQIGFHYEDRSRPQPLQLDIAEVAGSTDLTLTTGDSFRLVAGDGNLSLRDIALAGTGEAPAVSLASAQIVNVRVDSAAKRLHADAIRIDGGTASIVRETDGDIALLESLGFGQGDSRLPSGKQGAESKSTWDYAFETVTAEQIELTLADRSYDPPVRYDAVLRFKVEGLASDQKSSMPFEAALAVKQGGRLEVRGTGSPGAGVVNAKINVDALALPPLQPIIQRFAALKLESGTLSAQSDLSYESDQNVVQVNAAAHASDVLLNEAGSGDRLLSWKQLTARGVQWRSGAERLSINEIIATEPQAKIVISKDRQVNLAQVWQPQREQSDGTNAAPARLNQQSDGEPLRFNVGHFRMRRGVIDFVDHSLVLPFSTRVTAVNGAIAGISSDLTRHAQVKARGNVEPYGSATVEGSIEVFEPTRLTDLHVTFNNVLMSPLSPYTATFAGRKIELGRLWLDLNYEIKKGELAGSNDIRIENFTLGERVKAPSAMDLPLDLLVALLKDASGTIRMSVPVEGDLGNPRFSIASAVRSALGNFAQKIVTAPFRALAEMFGFGDPESLAEVSFAPGSARFRPEARERLDVITRALRERPQLQLVVTGPYDKQVDTEALRRRRIERDLAQALGRALEPGDVPGPINFDDRPTQQEIENRLAARAGRDVVETLKRTYGPDARAAYRAMFERLVDLYPLPDAAAQMLAAQRAEAIASYLSQSGIGRDRVRTGRVREVEAGQKNRISAELRAASDAAS